MRKSVSLTDSQIELLMRSLQTFVQIQKLINPKAYLNENELQKISEYTNLYEVLAEQYYDKEKFFKKIS